MEYTIAPFDNDLLFTITEPGKYQGVAVKIVNLQFEENEKEGATFEIELPKSKEELFNDTEFLDIVQDMVGNAVQKSTDALVKQQEDIIDLETKVTEILKKYGIEATDDQLFLEKFMLKGYLLVKDTINDNETVMAIDIATNDGYNLNEASEFNMIRSKIFPSIILN